MFHWFNEAIFSVHAAYLYMLCSDPAVFSGCLPVHVMYQAGSSDGDGPLEMFSLELSNFTVGIQDPSIFYLPLQCTIPQVFYI